MTVLPLPVMTSPAAPWLDWIEGTAFLPYLDPAGRGPFFPGTRSFAAVHGSLRLENALPCQVTDPNDVLVVGDVVSVPTVHLQISQVPLSSQDKRSMEPWDETTRSQGHFVPNVKINRSTCV